MALPKKIASISIGNPDRTGFSTSYNTESIIDSLRKEPEVRKELGRTWELKLTFIAGTAVTINETVALQRRKIVRVTYDDGSIEEWRIASSTRDASGEKDTIVKCDPIWLDLGDNRIRKTLANGHVMFNVPFYSMTVTEILNEILTAGYNCPSHLTLGTVDASFGSDEISVLSNNNSHLEVIKAICKEVNGEWEAVYNGVSDKWEINLEASGEIGGTVAQSATRPVEMGKGVSNRISLTRGAKKGDFFSRVVPIGGIEGSTFGIQRAEWPIESSTYNGTANETTITLQHKAIIKDGFPNNSHFGDPAVGVFSIVSTSNPNQVVVSGDATALTTGKFLASAGGNQLSHIEDADAVNQIGDKEIDYRRNDITPFDNLLEDYGVNPDFSAFNTNVPVGWQAYGGATLAQETDPININYGNSAVRVSGDAGQGIETVPITINPTTDEPYFSFWVAGKVLSGAFRIELVDSAGTAHPVQQKAETNSTTTRAIQVSGIEPSAGVGYLRITAIEAGSVFVVDAVTLTQSTSAYPYTDKMGGRALFIEGSRYLRDQGGLSSDTYEAELYDMAFDDESYNEIVVGSFVEIKDSYNADTDSYAIEFTGRVYEVEYQDSEIYGRRKKKIKVAKIGSKLSQFFQDTYLSKENIQSSPSISQIGKNPNTIDYDESELDAQGLLDKIKTVDGYNSGLTAQDSGLWEGNTFANWLNQPVRSTDNVTFAIGTFDALRVGASVFSGNEIARLNGNVLIDGNLEIGGFINYVNETNLQVEDKTITVNKNGTDASAVGAGMIIERPLGNQSMLWSDTTGFTFSDKVHAPEFEVAGDWLIGTESVGAINRLSIRGQAGNANVEMFLHPIGTADGSRIEVSNDSQLNNYNSMAIESNGVAQRIISRAEGNATILPMEFRVAGDETISMWSNDVKRFGIGSGGATFSVPIIAGSITSGFGNIDIGASSLSAGTGYISGTLYLTSGNGYLLSGDDSKRIILGGGGSATSGTGAYIIVEGQDFSGLDSGGNIYFRPSSAGHAHFPTGNLYVSNTQYWGANEYLRANPSKTRFEVHDTLGNKIAMGYLDGLPKNDASGNWDSNHYGFWVKAGDRLTIDGDMEYTDGDWLVEGDATIKIQDGINGYNIINLGTVNGEKGLFYFDGSASENIVAKFGFNSALIAGWNIDPNYFWTGTKQTTNAFSSSGITLASSGAIRSPEFRVDTDGKAYFAGDVAVNSFPRVSDEGLQLLWRFDEKNPSVIVDSKNGNNATVTGSPTWTNSPTGSGIDFGTGSSTGNSINVSGASEIQLQTYTYTFWIYRKTGANGSFRNFISHGPNRSPGVWLHSTDDDRLHFSIEESDGTFTSINPYGVTVGQWNFVELSVEQDGTQYQMKAYVNGVLENTLIKTATAIAGNGSLTIGNQDVKIAGFRVFNRILTENERRALYLYPSGNSGGLISASTVRTGVLQSRNFTSLNGNFTNQGTYFDLDNGNLYSEQFGINNGNAYFKGTLEAPTGTLGNLTVNGIITLDNGLGANITSVTVSHDMLLDAFGLDFETTNVTHGATLFTKYNNNSMSFSMRDGTNAQIADFRILGDTSSGIQMKWFTGDMYSEINNNGAYFGNLTVTPTAFTWNGNNIAYSGSNVSFGTGDFSGRLFVSAGDYVGIKYTRAGTGNPTIELANGANGSLVYFGGLDNGDAYVSPQGINGFFGVGTTSPSYKLDVNGSFQATGNSRFGGNVNASGTATYFKTGSDTSGWSGVFGNTRYGDSSSNKYGMYLAYDAYWNGSAWQANRTTIGSKWMLDMGYHTNQFRIRRYNGDVTGTWTDSAWTTLAYVNSTGTFFANEFEKTSDRRLKENITPLTGREFRDLNSVSFRKNGRFGYGFIAQEIEKHFPSLVTLGEDGFYTLAQDHIIAMNTAGLQLLDSEVDELRGRVKELEEEVRTLKQAS